jgi:hypothetical protein
MFTFFSPVLPGSNDKDLFLRFLFGISPKQITCTTYQVKKAYHSIHIINEELIHPLENIMGQVNTHYS